MRFSILKVDFENVIFKYGNFFKNYIKTNRIWGFENIIFIWEFFSIKILNMWMANGNVIFKFYNLNFIIWKFESLNLEWDFVNQNGNRVWMGMGFY